MAQTGFTPITLYNSATASAVPTAGNLVQGELAVNVTDKKLFTKNGAATVVELTNSATNPLPGTSVSNTPAGNIAATTAQAAINELDTEKVAKSGDTMTGPLAQAAGSAALPSYTFSGDTNTGMWSPAADTLAWSTAGSERLRIDTSGNVLVTGSGGLGYGVGSGGTVTQATSKSTAVTLNKPSGVITMNNAALGAGATVAFLCSNSLVAAGDICLLSINFGSAAYASYSCWSRCDSGAVVVYLKNISAGILSDALQIQFCIIKGVAS